MEQQTDSSTPTLDTAPDAERERGEQVILEEFGSREEFMNALEATIKPFEEGDIVEGVIVRVDADEALLDIGFKSEGVIPSKELSIKHDVDPHEAVAVGDLVEALVMQKEDQHGRLVLSKKRAQYERAWGKIEEIFNNDSTVTGRVIEVVKGGLIIDIGLRGFLPASLVEMRRVRDLHPYVGRELECKVIELDKNRNNVVLSRRKFLEETQSEFRREFLETLQKGEVRKGTVSSIVNFGAFVDLGGVDGLVHVSELSWKHVDHPGEVVEVGQEVEAEVLDVDLDRERVSLSLKATQEDPWQQFARQHYVGEFVEGRVTKLVPFGAFVKVAEGIEGLVHISELAEAHVETPEQVVQVGEPRTVKIIDIDEARRRISLSLKQAVKAGYGEEPEIAEPPSYSSQVEEPAAEEQGAVGAAFAQAFQAKSDSEEEAEEDSISVADVVADLRGQVGQEAGASPEADEPSPDQASQAAAESAEPAWAAETGDELARAAEDKDSGSTDEAAEAETPDEAAEADTPAGREAGEGDGSEEPTSGDAAGEAGDGAVDEEGGSL
jgi:small subunit ribosomal protein S1